METFQNEMRSFYWKVGKRLFWSDGYFVASTGDASSATVYKYIENQG